ncbi:MAG: UDP-N-acetylmuramoyl-tripeptide--D-alanyl-D-alanine ligase [Bacteroidales bacterium]|nr:UDP-N-acetylmuramoyl-tripeptide--D-alanyl-D-alanine ligase [Bacteroidales bacterium]
MIEELYNKYLELRAVTTDSRNIKAGSIFFALKGDKFDGNQFAKQALDKGAAMCVIDDPACKVDDRCMVVDNVLATLQELARYHRSRLEIPVIGITGTNGKTTTKELVNAVLSRRYRTWATQGNLNNHIGVPLTLLSMPADTEIAIVEMGASHIGEIDFLCKIANPDFGLITNVGRAHLEGFGSFKNVVFTKTELYKHLAAMAGVIFVNADDRLLMEHAEKMAALPSIPSMLPGVVPSIPGATPQGYTDDFHPRGVNLPMASLVTYGSNESAEFKGSLVGADPYMKFYFEDDDNVYTVQSHLIGGYNFANAMAAVCVGRYFGVELFDIKTAIEEYQPSNNRSQYKRTSKNALVLDCYNANPSSMELAIDNFAAMKAERKMVILGGMRELGADSRREHVAIVEKLKQCGFEKVILIGEEFRFAEGLPRVECFADTETAAKWLAQYQPENCTILVKGSNSNRLWTLEEYL